MLSVKHSGCALRDVPDLGKIHLHLPKSQKRIKSHVIDASSLLGESRKRLIRDGVRACSQLVESMLKGTREIAFGIPKYVRNLNIPKVERLGPSHAKVPAGIKDLLTRGELKSLVYVWGKRLARPEPVLKTSLLTSDDGIAKTERRREKLYLKW